MWGIPRCCHFSGVLTTLAHQSLRLLVRPCTDYINNLVTWWPQLCRAFRKAVFFLIAWQMLSHFFSSLCAVTYKTVCAWVRACVCVFVRTRNLRDRVRETRGESSRNKIPLLGQLFFFFYLFVSRSLSLGGAQWTADILLLISIPPLATSLVFNIGTSGAQLSFVAYSSSQRVIFFSFYIDRPSLLVTPSVESFIRYIAC